MLPYLQTSFGNPSTAFGSDAAAALRRARAALSSLLNAPLDACSIVFEGSATESIHHVILGLCFARSAAAPGAPAGHMVIGATEHAAVQEAARFAEARLGVRVTRVAPARSGAIPPEAVAAALSPDTFLVSIMLANNESGAVSDVAAIAARVRASGCGAFVHCDASQAVGKLPVDFLALGAHGLTLAGHKLYAPKGCGATVLLQRAAGELAPAPLLHGGGQEGGARAGTENVPYIAALGAAAAEAEAWLAGGGEQATAALKARLAQRLAQRCAALGAPAPVPTLHPSDPCLSNTLSIAWPGLRAAALRDALAARGCTVAAGAACHSTGTGAPSAVLLAMGVPRVQAQGTLRLSLLRTATAEDVEAAAEAIALVVAGAAGGAGAGEAAAAPVPAAPLAAATQALFLLDTEAYSAAQLTLAEAWVLGPGEAPKTPQGPPLAVNAGVILGATVAHAQGGGQPGDRGVLIFSSPAACAFCFVTARYCPPPRHAQAIAHLGWWLQGSAAAAAAADPQAYADGLAFDDTAPTGAVLDEAALVQLVQQQQQQQQQREQQVACFVSAKWRTTCAALHSSGHLLDGAVKRALGELALHADPAIASAARGTALQGGKGNHSPFGPPSVEYVGAVPPALLPHFTERLAAAVAALVQEDEPTAVLALADRGELEVLLREAAAAGDGVVRGVSSAALRGMEFPDFTPGRVLRLVAVGGAFNICPCGGTHVKRASKLAQLVIGKITSKKGTTKIQYTC